MIKRWSTLLRKNVELAKPQCFRDWIQTAIWCWRRGRHALRIACKATICCIELRAVALNGPRAKQPEPEQLPFALAESCATTWMHPSPG